MLSTAAQRVLRRRLDAARAFVFESPGGPLTPDGLSHAFRRVREEAGLPEWVNLHATRHTALTRLAERGVPVPLVQRFAGHANIATTIRYCLIADDVYADRTTGAFDP